MSQRLLEGEVVDGDSLELERMRKTVERLTRELHDSQRQNEDLRQRMVDINTPVTRLRQQLEPLYRALQGVWGELDEIEPNAQPSAQSAKPPQANSPIWESWKARLGGAASKIIVALQQHGELNTQQLSIITQLHRTTVPGGIHKLSKAGLLNKNGGRFSLKQIGS